MVVVPAFRKVMTLPVTLATLVLLLLEVIFPRDGEVGFVMVYFGDLEVTPDGKEREPSVGIAAVTLTNAVLVPPR